MNLSERIESFSKLGEILRESLEGKDDLHSDSLKRLIDNQQYKNSWFTPGNVRMAVRSIAEELTNDNIAKWCSSYPGLENQPEPLNVGIVMAGNIPLAGFHDFISVLITGNNLIAKTSSKDPDLIVFISDLLCNINPGFKKHIFFTDKTLAGINAIIATGSDNTSRYFEYYFGKYPNIIRKNRNSIAIIDGTESESQIHDLGIDIFSYFGLGCRSVSKIYIPAGYDISILNSRWNAFSDIINHSKYANNYDFRKAILMVNRENFTDTGYLLMTENTGLSSPVAVLYYEHYESPEYVLQQTEILKEKIQCVVGTSHIPFGKAQSPHLWDYADGIDTIEFLLKKKVAGIL
jgi:hypothetical protein